MRWIWPEYGPWGQASAAALTLALVGCGQGAQRAAPVNCDPLADTGCPAGEHCRLGEDGQRLCLAQTDPPDTGCLPETCAPGEACTWVEGLLACRPLCALEGRPCVAPLTCAYALTATLGVCVAPCAPFGPDGAGASAGAERCESGTCAPTPHGDFLICQAIGPVRSGGDCNAERCGQGLACLGDEAAVTCRTLCPAGDDAFCPPPLRCLGLIQGSPLGFCVEPATDAGTTDEGALTSDRP